MDANTVYKILDDIKSNKESLSLYTFKFDKLVKVDTWISELNLKDLKLGFLKKRFKIVEAIIGSREDVFLYSESARVALSSKFLKIRNNEIFISFPDESLITDLRKDTRLDIDLKVKMKLNGKQYSFDTFDIGYDGLSLIVREKQKAFFKEGVILEKVILSLAGKEVLLNLEIRNFIKVDAYSFNDIPFAFFRVGMHFVDISEKKKIFIQKVIDLKKSVG